MPKHPSRKVEVITLSDSDTPSKRKPKRPSKPRKSRPRSRRSQVIHIESDTETNTLFNPQHTLFNTPSTAIFPQQLRPPLIIPPIGNDHLMRRNADRLRCAKSLCLPLTDLVYGNDGVLSWKNYTAFEDLQTEINDRLEDDSIARMLGRLLRAKLLGIGTKRLEHCIEHGIPIERIFIGRGGLPEVSDQPIVEPLSVTSLTSAEMEIPSPSIVLDRQPIYCSSSSETDPHPILDIETTLQPGDTRHIVHDVDVYNANGFVNTMDFEVYLAPPGSDICETQAVEMVVDNVETLEAQTGDLGGVDIGIYDDIFAGSSGKVDTTGMYSYDASAANSQAYSTYQTSVVPSQQEITAAVNQSINVSMQTGRYYNNWTMGYYPDIGEEVDLYSAD